VKRLDWLVLAVGAVVLGVACGGSSVNGGEGGEAGDAGESSGGKGSGGKASGGTSSAGTSFAGSSSAGTSSAGTSFAGSSNAGTSSGGSSPGTGGSGPVPECKTSDDCPLRIVACTSCSDGSFVCPTTECVMGICVPWTPPCPVDPCANLACGEPCSTCVGDQPCPAIDMTCDAAGVCSPGQAVCFEECTTTGDCAAPEICEPCADGSCATRECLGSTCTSMCPSGRMRCETSVDCPPLPPVCLECPNGSCQANTCIDNECRVACSTDDMCMTAADCEPCGLCINRYPEEEGAADVACFPSACVDNRCAIPCP
jgi:hypothetical protein